MILYSLGRLALTLFSAALVFSLGSMLIHEHIRWDEASKECFQRRIENANVLLTDMCRHGLDARFGPDALKVCSRAEAENTIWPLACTARLYWKKSEPYRLYSMYAESHWMLFGITSVICAVLIQQLFSLCKGSTPNNNQQQHPAPMYMMPYMHPSSTPTLPSMQSFLSPLTLPYSNFQAQEDFRGVTNVKRLKRKASSSPTPRFDQLDALIYKQRLEEEHRKGIPPFHFECEDESDYSYYSDE